MTRLFLAAYFLLFLLFAFVWRSFAVYRRTGINPLVLPSTDDAYGYVGRGCPRETKSAKKAL